MAAMLAPLPLLRADLAWPGWPARRTGHHYSGYVGARETISSRNNATQS